MRVVAMIVLLSAAAVVVNAESVEYGIYVDTQMSECCIDTVPVQPFDVYVALTELPSNASVYGWEMQFTAIGSLYFLNVVYEHSATNYLPFPDCMVAFPAPVTAEPLVLARITLMAMGPCGVLVAPCTVPSLPDTPWPVVAFGLDMEDIAPVYPAYGSLEMPQLWVGPGDCPEEGDSLDIIATQTTNWSGVKALFH